MAERQIFPLASGQGFAAVIHENIVLITAGMGAFQAHVYAFPADDNGQYRSFDTAAEATPGALRPLLSISASQTGIQKMFIRSSATVIPSPSAGPNPETTNRTGTPYGWIQAMFR